VRRADNFTTFTCRPSSNLGTSSSWKPQGLSRPVHKLLYLLFYYSTHRQFNKGLHYTRINSTHFHNEYTWSYVPKCRNPCLRNFQVTGGNLELFTSNYWDSTAVIYRGILINQQRALHWISLLLNPSTGTHNQSNTDPPAVLFTSSVILHAGRGKYLKS